MRGRPLLKFLTGYVVELSLSADNVFVIATLFGSFAIPQGCTSIACCSGEFSGHWRCAAP